MCSLVPPILGWSSENGKPAAEIHQEVFGVASGPEESGNVPCGDI